MCTSYPCRLQEGQHSTALLVASASPYHLTHYPATWNLPQKHPQLGIPSHHNYIHIYEGYIINDVTLWIQLTLYTMSSQTASAVNTYICMQWCVSCVYYEWNSELLLGWSVDSARRQAKSTGALWHHSLLCPAHLLVVFWATRNA